MRYMKKHAIIPIFIPNLGCPKNCVFCDQKTITQRSDDVSTLDAKKIIDEWLTTLSDIETVEVSFYGGSFTGIPLKKQIEFLELAKGYKDRGDIDKIHLSTRPDYISKEILDNLKKYSVDTVELGVQSFSEEVLKASGRGHEVCDIYEACDLIKSYGFELGIQLMIGLPKDTFETDIYSANETVKIQPKIARIYPTVTLKDTELYKMYEREEYIPLTLEEQVKRAKEMYKILTKGNVNVIRMGLKSSEVMNDEMGFHPAFSSIVKGEIAKEIIEKDLSEGDYIVKSNSKSYGNIFGYEGKNRQYFKERYPKALLSFEVDDSLNDEEYVVLKEN